MKHSKEDRKKGRKANNEGLNDHEYMEQPYNDKKQFKDRPDRNFKKPYAMQDENPELGNFKKLLDNFYLSSSTPFDANLYAVLVQLSERVRLTKSLKQWLVTHSKDMFYNSAVHRAFHLTEAKWYLDEFAESHDPLSVISASDHYVEAKLPETAIEVLMDNAQIADNKNNKVVAFYFNTLAAAYRELREFHKGYEAVQKAFKADKSEIRTTQLLGSLSLHVGETDKAVEWYNTAMKNGLTKAEVHEDMKATVKVMSASLRYDAVKRLYAINQAEYSFLRGLLPKKLRGVA